MNARSLDEERFVDLEQDAAELLARARTMNPPTALAGHCHDDDRPLHLDGCTCGGIGFGSHLRDCQWSQR